MKNLFIFGLLTAILCFSIGCENKNAANTAQNNNSVVANSQPPTNAPQAPKEGECSQGTAEPDKVISSPTEAYSYLFEAVKAKNIQRVKEISSPGSRQLADFMAGTYKKSCDEVYKNGFTETTFNEKMPQTRDLQIKDNFATLEVKNAKGNWEVIPFIKEGENWKIAIGEMFFGKFTSPGKPQSIREQELANIKAGNKMIPYAANVNKNTKVIVEPAPDITSNSAK